MKKLITLLVLLAAFHSYALDAKVGEMACPSPGSFTLNNPSASNVGSTSITLSWSSSSDAINYTVYYKLSSSSSWTPDGTTGSLTKTINGLTAGSTYDFKVTANRICFTCSPSPVVCDELIEEESHTDSNTRTETMEPPTPTIQTPISETASSFTARWNSASGASSYKLDVSTSASFSSGNIHTDLVVTGTSRSVTGLDAGVRHYYRVRAVNGNGESNESSSTSAYTIPDAPTLNEAGSISSTSFTATWNSVTGAESYRMDVSTNSDFSSFISGYNNKVVSVNSETVAGLSGGTTYFFRVRAYDNGGNHTSADSETKSVLTLPAAPSAGLATEITQTCFTANWSTVSGADDYLLDVSTDDFTTYLAGYEAKVLTSTSEVLTGLNTATEYQYRVRSRNATGESPYSSTEIGLTIPATPASADASGVNQTSFIANWDAVDGGENYLLDVSEDNFSTFLTGYESRMVTGNSEALSGLSAGVEYQYRVRSENSSGSSPHSTIQEVLTISGEPLPTEETGVSQTSFTINWSWVTGADHYLLDVSIDDFSTFLSGYEAKIITNTSEVITALDPGTRYYYRLRSENASGFSDYSATKELITVPADPSFLSAESITQNSFTARWNPVSGIVDNYLFDLSTSPTFSSFVEGFNGKVINGTSDALLGLDPGVAYFYRVRSENSSGVSGYSDSQSVLTIPATPLIMGFSDRSATRVKVSWEHVQGADTYEIMVSENSDFTTLVAGNDPLVVSASLSEDFIQGLTPATVYYVKIRSRNSTDASGFSAIGTTATTDSQGNSLDPKIEIANADVASINFNVSGGLQGISSVKLFHKRRVDTDFIEKDLDVAEDGVYFLNVQPEWLDDFGMDYRIEVEDGVGAKAELSNKVLRQVDRVEVTSVLSFGSEIENYSIISVPYDLNSTIEDIFERILGAYDHTKWRIVQYRNGDNFDFSQGLSKEPLARGNGYWFISTQEVELNLGSAIAPENTRDDLFEMNLAEGWNQIGNPYPFNINWSEVLSHNADVLGISPLFVFDPEAKSFVESDELQVFGGGFVFAEAAVTLEIPIAPLDDSGSGRVSGLPTFDGWELRFNVSSGEVKNSLSSIGMRADASHTFDKYDRVTLPRFVQFAEFKSKETNDLGYHLSRDFVDQRPEYKWDFLVSTNASDYVSIGWDISQIPHHLGLFMYDKTDNIVINMKDIEAYEFTANKEVSIYALEGYDQVRGIQSLGNPYPNPIIDELTIPFDFGLSNASSSRLIIFHMDGSIAYEGDFNDKGMGLKELEWNLQLQDGQTLTEGMYLYSIYRDDNKISSGRLIKK